MNLLSPPDQAPPMTASEETARHPRGPAEDFVLERRDRILTLTLNRPHRLNALGLGLLRALASTLDGLADDPGDTLGLLLTGTGRAFCAGADVKELAGLDRTGVHELAALGQHLPTSLTRLPFPVIACVDGPALGGGCELALGADLIYATEDAQFGQPEAALGLIPGFGGTVRLPRRVGPGTAARMILGGLRLSGESARRAGLVDQLFAHRDEMLDDARAFLRGTANLSRQAIALAKRSLVETAGAAVPEGLQIEAGLYRASLDSTDGRARVAAFAGSGRAI